MQTKYFSPYTSFCYLCLLTHIGTQNVHTKKLTLINFLYEMPLMDFKQLLDEVFVISRIIKVEVRVISRRLRLITLTETLIISDITKTESNNCFIIHCFKANNDKRIIALNTVYFRHAMFLLRCP